VTVTAKETRAMVMTSRKSNGVGNNSSQQGQWPKQQNIFLQAAMNW